MTETWMETAIAAAELGLKPKQLRKLREQMQPGFHFRVKNRRSARPEYLWNVERIKALLVPVELFEEHQQELSGDRSVS